MYRYMADKNSTFQKRKIPLHERATHYNITFPSYPKLIFDKGWLYGVWLVGGNYESVSGYYGGYPPSYLKRIVSLFPDVDSVLHLFSGRVEHFNWKTEKTFDINPELSPDYVGDVVDIDSIVKEKFDLVIADPPYEEKDFEVYGTVKFNKSDVIKKIANLVVVGGFLVWLDLFLPMYRRELWENVGHICFIAGNNRRVRLVSIFERR